jgi:hypothetical protein
MPLQSSRDTLGVFQLDAADGQRSHTAGICPQLDKMLLASSSRIRWDELLERQNTAVVHMFRDGVLAFTAAITLRPWNMHPDAATHEEPFELL